jgi:HlyD family secretion protein
MTLPKFTTGRILALLLPLVAIAGAVWYFAIRKPGDAARFHTAAAETGDLTEVISANGTINPVRVVNVGSQVSGTVQKLYADYNDKVTAGQVLLELDPQLFKARLAQSEGALANARAQAALSQANAARAGQLRRQDFISQQDYETALATARSQAAQVASAQAAADQDRANLGFSIIRAPVSGVIISRAVDIGQTVAASFQTPTLFTIAQDLTEMQIEALVAEADVARVQLGQKVSFTVDAYGNRPFAGTVSQVRLNPTTQQNVVTFTVIVAVPNPDGALLPGMTVNASFLVRQYDDVLLVPNSAMSWKPAGWNRQQQPKPLPDEARLPGYGTTIFVLGPGGEPEPRRIRVGAADNDMSVVLGGQLKAGEKVITGDLKPAESARPGGPPPG